MTHPWQGPPGHFAGVGARAVADHPEVGALITRIAFALRDLGWTCRSGGAPGGDAAFEFGASCQRMGPARLERYLPYHEWRGHHEHVALHYPTPGAHDIAAAHHPAWSKVPAMKRSYLARTSHIILGRDVMRPEPVAFVLCWTEDGACAADETTRETGGTGQAIRVACAYGVPVYNLKREGHRAMLEELIR